jgi:hypothetical protein
MLPENNFVTAKEKASQQYDGAFHLLNVTFPMVRDPKLLMGVVNNIFNSLEHGMDAILAYERQLRLVPVCSDDYTCKFNMFRMKSVRRNSISPDIVNLMIDLKELIELQKKSPMEFQRGNRFVICSKDYRMKIISIKELKHFLGLNKEFLQQVEQILSKYNRKV